MIFDLNGNYSVGIWGLIVISAFMMPLSWPWPRLPS